MIFLARSRNNRPYDRHTLIEPHRPMAKAFGMDGVSFYAREAIIISKLLMKQRAWCGGGNFSFLFSLEIKEQDKLNRH